MKMIYPKFVWKTISNSCWNL